MKVPMFKFFRQHDRYAKRYLCAYCEINAAEIGEYEFMLKPDLWRQCGGRRRPVNRDDYKNLDCGMLCIGCIRITSWPISLPVRFLWLSAYCQC